MPAIGQVNLVLFMTGGMSLAAWDRIGMFEREVALYRALRPHLGGVRIVTYGDREDLALAERLPGIDVTCNRLGLSAAAYRFLVARVVPRTWRRPAVVKTNQVPGADTALAAARTAGARLVGRCGYLPSEIAEFRAGTDSEAYREARALEARLFTAADRVVVTTDRIAREVSADCGLPEGRVAVIPNYVETDLFRPLAPAGRAVRAVCFVGRLDEVKNPLVLVQALAGTGLALDVIGDGPLKAPLRQAADAARVPLRLLGNRPHRELPALMAEAGLFVLPSHREGHPKTLLEAMACGLPVIGTDVPGIREVIRHRDTGFLCGTSLEDLRKAIEEVVGDAALRAGMGERARAYVVDSLSLERTVARELALLEEVAA